MFTTTDISDKTYKEKSEKSFSISIQMLSRSSKEH